MCLWLGFLSVSVWTRTCRLNLANSTFNKMYSRSVNIVYLKNIDLIALKMTCKLKCICMLTMIPGWRPEFVWLWLYKVSPHPVCTKACFQHSSPLFCLNLARFVKSAAAFKSCRKCFIPELSHKEWVKDVIKKRNHDSKSHCLVYFVNSHYVYGSRKLASIYIQASV